MGLISWNIQALIIYTQLNFYFQGFEKWFFLYFSFLWPLFHNFLNISINKLNVYNRVLNGKISKNWAYYISLIYKFLIRELKLSKITANILEERFSTTISRHTVCCEDLLSMSWPDLLYFFEHVEDFFCHSNVGNPFLHTFEKCNDFFCHSKLKVLPKRVSRTWKEEYFGASPNKNSWESLV